MIQKFRIEVGFDMRRIIGKNDKKTSRKTAIQKLVYAINIIIILNQ